MILRIVELKGLRCDDIKGDYIFVHAFMNERNEIVPYCKGHTDAGMRYLPLTKACIRILMNIKLLLTQTVSICSFGTPDTYQP
ncbi:MAG: Phage integrase family [Herbinix sp.]|jgi:hypothetical protein|nr:Phage integrase family [Herbinix sp.]